MNKLKKLEQDRPNPEIMDLLIRLNVKAVDKDFATRRLYRDAYFSACFGTPPHGPEISARWFHALHDRLPENHRDVFLFDWRIEIDRLRAGNPEAAAKIAGHSMKIAAPGSNEEAALQVSFHDALSKIKPGPALRLVRSIFTEASNDNRQKQLLCTARHYLKNKYKPL